MLKYLHHLLIPHHGNNHRSKILHNASILLIIIFLLVSSFFSFFLNKVSPDILGISYSISDSELLSLVNQERVSHGLSPLTLNSELSDAARRKASDMLSKNYWAHFAPDGSTSPWTFIRDAGYSYTFAGENLAKGFTDANSTVVAWMASPTHRDNILSEKYKDVGFAIVPGTLEGEDTVLIVEMFGSRVSQTLATVPTQTAPQQSIVQVQAASDVQKPTISPTPTSIPTPTPTPIEVIPTQMVESAPLIDSATSSKTAATFGLSFLAFALIMDLVIVERKKIPRIVGHNLDHLILLLLFLLFIILSKGGVIL